METPDYTDIIRDIEGIITAIVPNAFIKVYQRKTCFGDAYVAIHIAGADYSINNVSGQYPAHVSLSLEPEKWLLEAQVYGGSGGNSIHREPDKSNDKEKYYAMIGIKIPFRRPKATKEAVYKAIQGFAVKWKQAVADNLETLCHRKAVDYAKAISDKN